MSRPPGPVPVPVSGPPSRPVPDPASRLVASMSGSASIRAERSAIRWVTGPGSQLPPDRSSANARRMSAVVGRSSGALDRHASTTGRSPGGSAPSSAGSCTVRNSIASTGPVPNGRPPVAAYTRTQPSEKTSLAGPIRRPCACSGERKPGDPTITSVAVRTVSSRARAIPKSISRGPSSPSSTLPGFTSRCTSPAAWTASSASASIEPSARTPRSGSGPPPPTASLRAGPGTNSVASHGAGASVSASTTGTAHRLRTCRAIATSRRKRARKPGSSAYSARISLIATSAPPGDRPSSTTPMPPAPSRPRMRYPAIRAGSAERSGSIRGQCLSSGPAVTSVPVRRGRAPWRRPRRRSAAGRCSGSPSRP
ncbi:hypothetical protein SFIMM107S_05093 [Streptomyces griseus]